MATAVIGLIVGSGLRKFSILKGEKPMRVDTPYGPPAEGPRLGQVGNLTVALLARHGRDHRVPPHRINHRANLWALKKLGVTRILATSSTGSLKPSIRPGGFVVPHDFIAFWNIPTFYDDVVRHVTPSLDETLRGALVGGAKKAGVTVRSRGVYVQTTGPRLETPAEISHFRTVGDVLGMTMASEATLANEIGLPYASLCSVDNYCNGIVNRSLSFDAIRKNQEQNAPKLRDILVRTLEGIQ